MESEKSKTLGNKESEIVEEVNLAVSLHRNTILLEINGRKTHALIDSGASISCIKKSFLDNYFKTEKYEITPSRLTRIIGVGGENHEVLGETKIVLDISGLKIEQTFTVLESLHHPVILGIDFMISQKVKIDFHHNIMSLLDDTVSLALACDSKFGYARCLKPEIIPANSEIHVKVRLSKGNEKRSVLLEPSLSLNSINLVGARCLVKPQQRKTFMKIANPTNAEVHISPNRVLATVNDIDEAEIYIFSDENESKITSETVANVNLCASKSNNADQETLEFEINNENLSDQEKNKLKQFLSKNRDVFSTSLKDMGKTDWYKHRIETIPGAAPVRSAPYRVDPTKKEEIENKVNEFLKDKVIERSTSVWNSPVVLVKKKDGSWRFAVDYRKLNQVTIPMSQPLPRLEDVFDSLGENKATIFSTLDLNSAYYQIELDPETKEKSSFVTHDGVFCFNRMPFGLKNAPMSFQLLMSLVLKNINWKFALCYIDDILVFSSDFETHLKHLGEVFQRLREAKLTLKPSKCEFGVNKVMFLGHIISKDGVQVDTAKTDKVQNFPVPHTQKELRGFLGLCNYYRRFVPDFGKISVPLNSLLKKEVKS